MSELKKNLTFKRAKRTPQQIDVFIKTRFSNALISNLVITDDNFSFTIYSKLSYDNLVNELVRERYSVSAELAILRQRDTKQDEFNTYNAYVEECKVKAKQFIMQRDIALQNK